VRTETRVTDITEHAVTVEPAGAAESAGDPPPERIPARTVLWAAGVQASTFARAVAAATGAETDQAGRVRVGRDLTIPGHPEIFVIGDAAVLPWKPDRPVPGVAQGGIQGGKYAASAILGRLDGERAKPFRFRNLGDVAVIGRLSGVTNIPWLGPFGRTGGFLAWLLWLGIHLISLAGFANRVIVLVRWAWSFVTHGRGSRLITGQPLLPDIQEPEPPA
jgi:NADH dehydrogenase